MLFSYNWLQSFLNKKLPNPKKLAELLTMSVVEIEGVEKKGDDFIFEVDNKSITNRPDLWGHAGLAREVGAIIKSKVHPPKFCFAKIVAGKKNQAEVLKVIVKEPKLCPRYLGLVIDNVKVEQSPKWMKDRIEGCGLDSINNVVDITNYVMLELGQPMHAFDFNKIANINSKSQIKKIIVRKARQSEKIVSLSGDEYDLDENVLVIADENPIAIAGIKGGKKSEINSETKTIILEAANFEPINVRKSARALDLRTDAAMRFEKGLDPNLAETAIARAIDLIKEIIPDAKIASSLADEKSFKEKIVKIKLPFEYVNKKIGLEIKKTEIISILKSLDFEIEKFQDYLTVKIPSWRAKDISIKDDLVEEIARIFGYSNIILQMPKIKLTSAVLNPERKFEREIKNILINNFGFSEVCNYSFVGENLLEKLNITKRWLHSGDSPVEPIAKTSYNNKMAPQPFGTMEPTYENYIRLANSISRDQTMMRQSLIPNLISNTKNNLRYFDDFRIFEIGRIFTKEKSDNKISKKENKFLPKQEKFISGVFIEKNNLQPFYKIKHCVEDLFKQLNVNLDFRLRGNDKEAYLDFKIPDEKEISSWAHPSRSLNILKNKKRIGIITEINPQVAENFGIKQRAGIFEISFGELFKISGKEKKYHPICKFPSVILDLSIIIDRKILWQEIQDLVFKTGDLLIKNVEPFDVYEGKNIPVGKKSLAFHITYQAKDRTLEDEEVKNLQDKIIKGLEEKLEAEIRSEKFKVKVESSKFRNKKRG